MSNTPILIMPELVESQANKYLTHNEALRRLEAVTIRALSATTTAQPGSPAEGDSYIIPAGATGAAWDAYSEGDVAFLMGGAWHNLTPPVGLRLYVVDEGAVKRWDGTAWGVGGGITEFSALTDTPSDYTGEAGKAIRVNAGEDALEFFEAALAQHQHMVGAIQATGGAEGQVPTINSQGDVVWADPPGATGGEANTGSNRGTGEGVFAAKSGVDLEFKSLVAGSGVTLSSDTNEITITADGGGSSALEVSTETVTAYTLVAADAGKYIRMDHADPNTVTVPDDATLEFPTGTQIHVRQAGAGKTSIAGAAGVTINTAETLSLRTQHSTVTLVKVGPDAWDLVGDLEASA